MTGSFGRRNFFGSLNKLMAVGGVMSQSKWLRAAPAVQRGEDYYEKLGVTKIINAAGTYTFVVQPRGNVPPAPVSGTPLTLGAEASGAIARWLVSGAGAVYGAAAVKATVNSGSSTGRNSMLP